MFTTLFYAYGLGQVFRFGPVGITAWEEDYHRCTGGCVSVVDETLPIRPHGMDVVLADLPGVAAAAPPERPNVPG